MKILFERTRRALIVYSCVLALNLQAGPFEDGIEAYQAGDFAAAQTQFESALRTTETAAAQHNLALAQFQLGAPAQAVWHLERASLLAPFNAEFRYKLGALRQQLGLFEHPPAWYEIAAQIWSTKVWAIIATLCFWVLVSAYLLPRMRRARAGLGIQTIRLTTCLLLLCAAASVWLNCRLIARGVIVSGAPVSLHVAPASASPESGQARPGERAQLREHFGDYYRIETEAGALGWVSRRNFRPLAVD